MKKNCITYSSHLIRTGLILLQITCKRYPGNDWTDIVGFDIYQRDPVNENFIKEFDQILSTLESIAKEKNKIPALTEFGYFGLPDSTWWTSTFWPTIRAHRISYALAWRNAGGEPKYFVPYKGEPSAADFVKFYNGSKVAISKRNSRRKHISIVLNKQSFIYGCGLILQPATSVLPCNQ